MAQIRGTAGYNLGGQSSFGGSSGGDGSQDPSPLDAIREKTSKIEDWLDTLSDPVKPYVVLRRPCLKQGNTGCPSVPLSAAVANMPYLLDICQQSDAFSSW